jgi:hypothetical protein
MINRLRQLVMSWRGPRQTQQQKILNALQKGPATNRDLSRLAPRFGARIMELRQIGHSIAAERDGRVVVYRLVGGR